jgi:hypothetical protein
MSLQLIIIVSITMYDTSSGKVRAVCGETYMLTQNEEPWEKDLPPSVEALLAVCIPPSISPSLLLFLPPTHTHTHTHVL